MVNVKVKGKCTSTAQGTNYIYTGASININNYEIRFLVSHYRVYVTYVNEVYDPTNRKDALGELVKK